jgi:hypothetical protein
MEAGSETGKTFHKAFAKGFAKILVKAFPGSEVARVPDHEGSSARLPRFGKGSSKSAKPRRKAFPTMPIEKSPAYRHGRGDLAADRNGDLAAL